MPMIWINCGRGATTEGRPSEGRLSSPSPVASRALFPLLLLFAGACGTKPAPERPPVSVSVATAERGAAPYTISSNGIVEPMQTVAIQSQVGGVLTAVRFKEGDEVKAGDVLFVIDPRPFKAALDQAVAALARDQAQAESAQRDADRYAALVQKDYVTKSQADQALANAAAQRAVVEADKAAVDNARFNLENATITAPITGKTGSLQVKQGNLVKVGSPPPLVVINQIHPILVHFTVPDRELPNFLKYGAGLPLKVRVTPRGDVTAEQGLLNFTDNAVDSTTGTLMLKAHFDNSDGRLWPGQFVTVVVELYVDQDAVLVPNAAVQVGQDGPFVYVVTRENKAEMRGVTPGRVVGDRTVIAKGLDVGSTVVTDGHSRLTPNAKVAIETNPTSDKPPNGAKLGGP